MIKIVHTADFQIGKTSNQIHINKMIKGFNSPVNIRTIDLFKKIYTLFNYCKENADLLIIAGDIFDNHIPKMYLKKWFAKLLSKLLKSGVQVILLVGNHDSDGNIHAFSDIKEFLNLNETNKLHIIDEPETFALSFDNSTIQFFCLPYLPPNYSKTYTQVIKEFNQYIESKLYSDVYKIFIGHFGISGGVVGKEHITKTDISPKLFTGYHYVALGDYHKCQRIKADGTKIYYSGSLQRNDFGEIEKKYFLELTLSNKNARMVVVKKIPVPDRLFLKIKITFRDLERITKMIRFTDNIFINGITLEKDSIIFFDVTALKSQIDSFDIEIFRELYKKIGIEFIGINWLKPEQKNLRSEEDTISQKTPMELMKMFLKEKTAPVDSRKILKEFRRLTMEIGNV